MLAALLLLALVVRFRYLLQIEHNVDHAYTVWQAMTTLYRGELPLAGQGTSVLFANPPLTGYLYLPVVAITGSPLGVYVLVIALNSLAVWFAYRAVLLTLGPRPALIAAALMAVNPWMIEYSRTSWVQALLPFFVSAVAWLAWPVLLGRSRRPVRRTALAVTMAALLAHTYLLAFFIVVPLALLGWIFRRRIPWHGVAIGGSVFAVLLLLYGIGLLGQQDTVSQRLESFGSEPARLSLDAWDAAVRLVSGSEYELARGLDAPIQDVQRRHDLSRIAHQVVQLALIAGLGIAAFALLRRKGTQAADAALILLLWFGLPVLAMSYTGQPVHSFYQLMGIPAGYALAAWGLHLTLRLLPDRVGGVALLILWLPFAALMLTNSARYYQETAYIPGAHGFYALPLGEGLALGQAVQAHRPPGGTVYIQAEEWIINSFSGALFSSIQDTRAPGFQTLPKSGGLSIVMRDDAAPVPLGAARVTHLPLADGQTITVDVLAPANQADLPGTVLDVPSEQGLTLHRFDLTQTDTRSWTLTTIWRVDAAPNAVLTWILQPFLHVYDAGGQRIVNISGEGLPGYRWQPDDLHVYQMPFSVPVDADGPLTLFVGQFDGAQARNVIFLPEAAEATPAIRLPLTLP